MLDIYDTNTPTTIATAINISKSLNTLFQGESIDFNNYWLPSSSWYNTARIVGLDQQNYGGQLAFYTKRADGTPGNPSVEAMRITSTGSVGIGTTGPGGLLEVNGEAVFDSHIRQAWNDVQNYVQYPTAVTNSPTFAMGWSTVSANRILYIDNLDGDGSATDPNGGIVFRTGGTPSSRMIVDYAGNVGIGTSSPNTNLDVGTGFIEWGGEFRVSSTFTKTSDTALAAITGLGSTLVAGKTYAFEIQLYTTGVATGGTKVDLNGGTATATAIIGQATSFDGTTVRTGTRVAALNTALCSNASNAAALCQIYGTITVNAGGTFIPRFAQNTSNATSSTVAIGSTMLLHQINYPHPLPRERGGGGTNRPPGFRHLFRPRSPETRDTPPFQYP